MKHQESEQHLSATGNTPETRYQRLVRLAVTLRRLGVSESHTQTLLTGYDLDVVEQQLEWLPYRTARKKASMIVAAIQQGYEKPANYDVEVEEDI